jgi:hypothetical protein
VGAEIAQHLEQFPTLLNTFPDATFVVTHRDPVEVTLSMATMISYASRMANDHPDPVAISRYWLDRAGDLLGGCLRDRDLLPAGQSIDVRFTDFMADEEGTIARIYELAGQPLTAAARAAMTQFRTEHPRGRHGGVRTTPRISVWTPMPSVAGWPLSRAVRHLLIEADLGAAPGG